MRHLPVDLLIALVGSRADGEKMSQLLELKAMSLDSNKETGRLVLKGGVGMCCSLNNYGQTGD